MKIVVLMKQVPDTYGERRLDTQTGRVDRGSSEAIVDEISERALEVALRYKDSHKGTHVTVLTMGPASANAALRKGLSMGADAAIHVLDDALVGADMGQTAAVLAAALPRNEYDLVIAGNESTDGRGGAVPAMLAEHLNLPHLSFLDSVELSVGEVSGERVSEYGSLDVRAPLPAVVSITERAAEARFPNFKGIMTAKRKPLSVVSLAELGLGPAEALAGARSVVLCASARPARAAGTKIVDEGNAGEQLAEFLAANRLI
ncbi:electron transfer flavoprotein subunit beta [Zafaria cholistanensis]|uniref:Electron transfer flavoprotein subunit beta n=1 Tax=Zafaria cholistanensis TaxID=1682741 RepID=A0A5A7NP64_9MICC|nr:electron transfer flavoprotein subunit beta/FixA family protein [Zafaria cholistanensis]GER22326.1 electron transfer flavoprotein subunit beta [Zafaria cholistanensis]